MATSFRVSEGEPECRRKAARGWLFAPAVWVSGIRAPSCSSNIHHPDLAHSGSFYTPVPHLSIACGRHSVPLSKGGGQQRTLTQPAAPPLPSYVYTLLARYSYGHAIRFRSSPALPHRAATSLSSERPVVRKDRPQAGISYTAEEVPSKDAVCLWGVHDRQVVGLVRYSLRGARSGSGRISSFTKRRKREGGEYTRREGRVTCRLSLIQVPPGPAPAPPSHGQGSFPHTLPSFRSSSTTAWGGSATAPALRTGFQPTCPPSPGLVLHSLASPAHPSVLAHGHCSRARHRVGRSRGQLA